MQVLLGPWLLPAASTLHKLCIHQDTGDIVIPEAAVLQRLTALQDLELCITDFIGIVRFEPRCRLPSQSLTSLRLGTNAYDAGAIIALPPLVRMPEGGWGVKAALLARLPSQVLWHLALMASRFSHSNSAQLSELSALQRLQLDGIMDGASCDVLANLPALRCLVLNNCWAPPPCLPKLTALRALSISHAYVLNMREEEEDAHSEEEEQAIADTCAFLEQGWAHPQLTALCLHLTRDLSITALPTDLGARLPALQAFAWVTEASDASYGGQLPAGLTRVRKLALPVPVAVRSAAQLAAASSLVSLLLYNERLVAPVQGEVAAVAELLQRLPSLRLLGLDSQQYVGSQ